jgi:hypothetical protein
VSMFPPDEPRTPWPATGPLAHCKKSQNDPRTIPASPGNAIIFPFRGSSEGCEGCEGCKPARACLISDLVDAP